jgi:exopolysaccharide biosynthesis polyprenyl glycosylphosphotransferase
VSSLLQQPREDTTWVARPSNRESEPLHELHDRRRPALGPRSSWAMGRPFIPCASNGPRSLARPETHGRRDWAPPFICSLVASDALCAAAVIGGLAATLANLVSVLVLLMLVSAAGWIFLIGALRGYSAHRIGSGPEEFQALLRAVVGVVVAAALLSYGLQLELPRRLVLVGIPAVALTSGASRYVIRRWLHRKRRSRQCGLRTLLVGDASTVSRVSSKLDKERQHGYHVVGSCLPAASALDDVPNALGGFADIPQVVVDHRIDVVLVTARGLSGDALRRLSWALEHTSAQLVVSPGLVEVHGPRLAVRPIAGLSLLHLEAPSQRLGYQFGKELLDRGLGLLLALFALPVILACALLVRVTTPGPAFFRQIRIGRDGSPFSMWKLRTMVVNAESLRPQLETHSDRDGLMFKMHGDPRITPIGRWLRRLSLDGLPQLFNVVRGDMSLVGPRPPLPREVEGYHDSVHRRLRVKPGLTGLWQVNGRADLDWEESVVLDLRYVDNWSVSMDLLILWKTLRAVVTGSGAY